MKKTICKILALCICLAMISVCFVGCGKDDVITIGLTGPLTGGASMQKTLEKGILIMGVIFDDCVCLYLEHLLSLMFLP